MTRRRLGYGSAYQDYRDAGWTPFPLPRGAKERPPGGITGDTPKRHDPTPAEYKRWVREFPDGNIALVMPATIIGLDVDVRHGGDKTLARLVNEFGDLPTTWESTSRDDGSGIALFCVPPGTRLVREIKDGGIELLQWWHRYAIVWPSVHPEGWLYQWWIGSTVVGIPKVAELPELPRKWRKGLAEKPKAAKDGVPYTGSVGDWLAELPETWTPPQVRQILREGERRFSNGECRHAAMLDLTAKLVELGSRGKDVYQPIHELADLFIAAVSDERDGEDEYWNAVEGAIEGWGGRKPKRQWPTAPWVTAGGAA